MEYTWPRNPNDSRILRCADIVTVLPVSSGSSLLQTPDTEVGCPGHVVVGLLFFSLPIILSASSVYSCDFCGVNIKALWTKELFGDLFGLPSHTAMLGHYRFLSQVSFVLFSLTIHREMLLLTHSWWKVPATWFCWPLEFFQSPRNRWQCTTAMQ